MSLRTDFRGSGIALQCVALSKYPNTRYLPKTIVLILDVETLNILYLSTFDPWGSTSIKGSHNLAIRLFPVAPFQGQASYL